MKALAATEARRKFFRLLCLVEEGGPVVITLRGRPVAKILPLVEEDKITGAAREILFSRLHSQPVRNVGRWTRDELYER